MSSGCAGMAGQGSTWCALGWPDHETARPACRCTHSCGAGPANLDALMLHVSYLPCTHPPQFYNGNAKLEPGAVVCRVARSFIRFGTFQLPATR